MEHMVTQEQADDAAAAAARFWPEFGRRWPWTRQKSLIPVYQRIGETTVSLLRAFPEIQLSNQRLWYQRMAQDAPAIYALFPEAFAEDARPFLGGADPRELEGKQVVSFIYRVLGAHGAEEVAKTLLATTELAAPYYQAQLGHELLNCFCATSWDGQRLRSGLRRAMWTTGAMAQQGGALNDLLIDTLLLDFLPRWTPQTRADLLEGMLGPYWQIVERYAQRFAPLPVRQALFTPDDAYLEDFDLRLETVLGASHASHEIDRLLASHDWERLRALAE